MKSNELHSRYQRSLKCKDCSIISDKVYHSLRYDVNLCVPCLMLRVKEDITQD